MGEQLGSGPTVPQRQEDDDPELRSLLALIKAAPPAAAPSYFALTLTKADSRQKADLLAACGDLFKQLFLRTRNESYCDDAVKAYELAVSCVPASDPEYLIFLQDVASWRLMRFNLRRDFADLDQAIESFETVVNNTPDTHRGMPIWTNNLSTALDTRFRRSGNLADLDSAISLQRRVLSMTTDTDPALPTRLNNLASLVQARYEKAGANEDIDEAKSLIEQCFKVIPRGNSNMRQCLMTRGSVFRLRHERDPNLADINEAIKFYQQAVDLQPVKDHRILASSLEHLGRSYYHRYILEGNNEDFEIAITIQRRGIDVSKDHPDVHRWLSRMSDTFLAHFHRTGKLQDLHSAIKVQEEAIEITPVNDTKSVVKHWQNLATLFFYHYEAMGGLTDINRAITSQQKAIDLAASSGDTYFIQLINLGEYLSLRFTRTQDRWDIKNAIEVAQKAVEVTREQNVVALQNLAVASLRLFRWSKEYSAVEQAISCMRKVADLPLSGKERENKHILLGNLGAVLIDSFNHEKNKNHITESIELIRSAIQMAPQGHINIPTYLRNLGLCLQARYQQSGNDEDINEAMVLHQQAIDLTTEGSADTHLHLWALGRDFHARYIRKGDPSDLLKAIDKFRQATLFPAGPPSVRLEISQWWTASSFILGPEHTLTPIESALQLQSQVAGLQETIDSRLGRIGRTKHLPTTAAAVAIRIGQFDKAIEWLEQGRCILWNQVNSLRTPLHELKDHDNELAEDILRVSSGLEKAATRESLSLPVLTADSESMIQRITEQTKVISQIELGKEWDRLVKKVRDIPRFKDFLRPPQFKDLLKDLPKNGIVVVITVHEDQFEEYNGCDALALVPGSKTAKHIPLEGFSYNRAEVLRRNLQDRLRRHGHRFGQADVDVDRGMRVVAEVGMNLSMQEILKELWLKVVRPILEALEIPCRPSAPQRVWWCLTGPLACFPLHAAGLYGSEAEPGSTATDYVISSCIPTLSTLTDRVRNPRKAPSDAEGLFIVSQPNTPDMPPIPGASAEAELIQSRVKGKISRVLCLEGKEVTIERALEEIQSHSCVHLACHAIQADDGSSSAFYLEDGELDLLEIIKKDIKIADFAFLSACQTSMGSDFFSEEAIHLAAGMLAAGYRGVVATMWSIKDKYGPVVADYFYEHLLGCEKRPQGKVVGSEGAACALHHAIIKLRGELDDSEASFLTWVPYVHLGL